MKIKFDMNAQDLMELNNPETTDAVIAKAHEMLDSIFENRDELIKCSITLDDKE